MRLRTWSFAVLALAACGGGETPPPARPTPVAAAPAEAPHPSACTITVSDTELRAKDGAKILDELAKRIRLGPEDDALRKPKSLDDVKKILHRDVIYLFPAAAEFARAQNTTEGRISEATIEFLSGETQLVASSVLNVQAAWVAADLRIARASLATTSGPPANDRDRLLVQLLRSVDDGGAIAAALAATAPAHVARGAEVIRALETEAPNDPKTIALGAEYHRLRGEWPEFEAAMTKIEGTPEKDKPAALYLRAAEQVERFHKPQEGAQMLRAALKKYPGFVRAQAGLVAMAPNPRSALRELQKLKAMNADHYLVMLLEPTLAADQELGRIENQTGQGGGADAPQ